MSTAARTAAEPAAVLPTLPADWAARLDAEGELRVVHPGSGTAVRLVPAAPRGPGRDAGETGDAEDDRPLTAAELDELSGGQTDMEAILEGIADADAGRFVSWEEMVAQMEAEFPELRGIGGGETDGEGTSEAARS